jgi:hypothetical protein
LAIAPVLGFGSGYAARTLGVSPLNASLLGLGVGFVYGVGGFSALSTASVWVVGDIGAGIAGAAGASYIVAGVAAVAIPVAIGASVAAIIGGEEGVDQFKEVITGKVSISEQVAALDRAHTRFEGSTTRAVENNAAGLPVGTPMEGSWESKNPQARYNPFTGEPNPFYMEHGAPGPMYR